MKTQSIKQLYARYLIPVYTMNGVAAARSRGVWLWNAEGKRYLDLFSGWGVATLGHSHPRVVKAIRQQSQRMMHIPNIFYQQPQAQLAQALVKVSFDGKVFFVNSGAETVEAAVKLARYWGNPKRNEIISMTGSFHGRTLGALSATGQKKYQRGFRPLPGGFRHVPFSDLGAVRRTVNKRTVAVLVEPIQGEGGIHVATKAYLAGLRKLCTQKKLLLIFDEVSTGMGRTGTFFAYQQYGVTPDLLLLAKPAAGGLPMGAMVARRKIADTWDPGAHATTFGGNAVATAASLAAVTAIQKEKLLNNVRSQSRMLFKRLKALKARYPVIREIRGAGFMIGLELDRPGAGWVAEALKRGLIINCTQERVIRLYPAITIKRNELERGLKLLEASLKGWLS